jgi:MFS family permease
MQSFGINPKDANFYLAILIVSFVAAQSISSPFWGRISDRFARRKLFLLSGAVSSLIGFPLFGLSKTYAMASPML